MSNSSSPIRRLVVAAAVTGVVVATSAWPTAPTAGASTASPAAIANQLLNASFEEPALPCSSTGGTDCTDLIGTVANGGPGIPGWSTTDSAFELWRGAPGPAGSNGIGAYAGNQYAELNAFVAGTLYQDVATTPGQTLTWSIAHRARGQYGAPDVMRVLAGPGGSDATLVALTPSTKDGVALVNPTPDISDGPGSTDPNWHVWSGTYLVPAGQTSTRFGFQAVSGGSGNPAVGNLLDAIAFGVPGGGEETCDFEGTRTLSQGGWGNRSSSNPLLATGWYATNFPTGVTIGGANNSISFTTADHMRGFLPQSGAPAVLRGGARTNLTRSLKNTLAGQTAALTLNLALSPDLANATFVGDFDGYTGTVSTLLTAANAALNGSGPPTKSTLATLTKRLDHVNLAFEGGIDAGRLECGDAPS